MVGFNPSRRSVRATLCALLATTAVAVVTGCAGTSASSTSVPAAEPTNYSCQLAEEVFGSQYLYQQDTANTVDDAVGNPADLGCLVAASEENTLVLDVRASRATAKLDPTVLYHKRLAPSIGNSFAAVCYATPATTHVAGAAGYMATSCGMAQSIGSLAALVTNSGSLYVRVVVFVDNQKTYRTALQFANMVRAAA